MAGARPAEQSGFKGCEGISERGEPTSDEYQMSGGLFQLYRMGGRMTLGSIWSGLHACIHEAGINKVNYPLPPKLETIG